MGSFNCLSICIIMFYVGLGSVRLNYELVKGRPDQSAPLNTTLHLRSRLTSHRVHNLKKFDNTGEEVEDLISIGTIGLIKAFESYRPNNQDREEQDLS